MKVLDWLSEYLKEDRAQEAARRLAEELEKGYVPIEDFRSLQEQSRLQAEEKEQSYKSEIRALRLDNAVEKALSLSGAKSDRAVRALLEWEKMELAEDGTVSGLKEQIEELKKSEAFLFEAAPPVGLSPAEAGDRPADKGPKDMSYEELCTYLSENPQAKLGD